MCPEVDSASENE